MPERVCVGVVIGVHGLRGTVRLKSFTADPAAIGAYGPVETEADGRRFRIRVTGLTKGAVLADLEGIGDRDAAEALKGTKLYVPRSALPATDEDEYYHADLVGLRVELADGGAYGTVRALHDFGAGDMLEVARPGGEVTFLPFSRQVVPVVDMAGGRLVVDPPVEVEGEGGGEAGAQDDGG